MSDGTPIEWTDATWNPITGCSVVSAGCKHCYAMKLAGTRLRHDPSRAGLTRDTAAAGPVWTGEVRFNAKWLTQPLRWKRPRRIFVCAHGDLFHESVPDDWIDQVFGVMALASHHTFQVLTKRAARMQAYLSSDRRRAWAEAVVSRGTWGGEDPDPAFDAINWGPDVLPNVWAGVSVEHQAAAAERIPLLLQTPAAVRWISAEPLLGEIDLTCVVDPRPNRSICQPCGLAWVVVGGESGADARPMHPAWARRLRDQCGVAGVAFLFKQWGAWVPHDLDRDPPQRDWFIVDHGGGVDIPDYRTPIGDQVAMRRLTKKAAGRRLDGHVHDAYPGEGGTR